MLSFSVHGRFNGFFPNSFVGTWVILKHEHYTKNEVFHQGFLQWMWPNPHEVLNVKLHFLCSGISTYRTSTHLLSSYLHMYFELGRSKNIENTFDKLACTCHTALAIFFFDNNDSILVKIITFLFRTYEAIVSYQWIPDIHVYMASMHIQV